MPSVDSINFDVTGFSYVGDEDNKRIWRTQDGDGIGLYFFPVPPDIEADIESVAQVRSFYRKLTDHSGHELIECETLLLDECLVVRTITSVRDQGTGYTYLGSLTFPFRDFSFVLKIQCEEQGMTGVREAVVFDQLLGNGEIIIDANTKSGPIPGWAPARDDPAFESLFTGNRSQEEKYDTLFPGHPLSRTRSLLRNIRNTVRVADEIRNAPKFLYPMPDP